MSSKKKLRSGVRMHESIAIKISCNRQFQLDHETIPANQSYGSCTRVAGFGCQSIYAGHGQWQELKNQRICHDIQTIARPAQQKTMLAVRPGIVMKK